MTHSRTTDTDVIEHRLLELAYTTDAKITKMVLAYFANCSIEDAEKVLDNLAARDRIAMEVDDDGAVFYVVPDRQTIAPRLERSVPRTIVRMPPPHLMRARPASPPIAALLSLFIPGAGQLYTGRWLSALLWFMVVGAGYTLILPGLVLHLFCIASAASSAHRLNSSVAQLQLRHGESWNTAV